MTISNEDRVREYAEAQRGKSESGMRLALHDLTDAEQEAWKVENRSAVRHVNAEYAAAVLASGPLAEGMIPCTRCGEPTEPAPNAERLGGYTICAKCHGRNARWAVFSD